MPVASVILVEPSGPANVGAAIRVAANFGVPAVDLVRPGMPPDAPEVEAWASGGGDHVTIRRHERFADAAAPHPLVAAAVSGRGRGGLPTIGPDELHRELVRRDASAALVFGNETSGLPRAVLDRTDLAVRIPTVPAFPVLNLAQAIAVLLGWLATAGSADAQVAAGETPASHREVEGLMDHAREALLEIGFLDPANPDRILRKLRRMLGRAVATPEEVTILRGICRQVLWAASRDPGRWDRDGGH